MDNRQIIIGSTAMKHWFVDFNREPKDLDIVVSSSRTNEPGIEYHLNPHLLSIETEPYITPNNMLTLKVSHMFWDNNWEKHMWDIQFLLTKGAAFDYNNYKVFREYWEGVLPKIRRSDLAMTKEDFFTNSVNEDTEQHDELHYMLNTEPMFTKLLKDGCDVELDESKWHKLSYGDKCNVVYEEVIIMMLERYNRRWQHAYVGQLKDNIIKHFPEYIALFAIFNYPNLELLPKHYDIKPLLTKLKKQYDE